MIRQVFRCHLLSTSCVKTCANSRYQQASSMSADLFRPFATSNACQDAEGGEKPPNKVEILANKLEKSEDDTSSPESSSNSEGISQVSFREMLFRSKLFQLGDPRGKLVRGVIEHTMGNDLYIDFGGKFPCVCKRPQKNAEDYIPGTSVIIRLLDLELSSRFLGSERDLTLCEADAVLVGLYGTKKQENKQLNIDEEKDLNDSVDAVS